MILLTQVEERGKIEGGYSEVIGENEVKRGENERFNRE